MAARVAVHVSLITFFVVSNETNEQNESMALNAISKSEERSQNGGKKSKTPKKTIAAVRKENIEKVMAKKS